MVVWEVHIMVTDNERITVKVGIQVSSGRQVQKKSKSGKE